MVTEEELGNMYAGVPNDLDLRFETFKTRAMERQIHDAIDHLRSGQNGKFTAVIALLGAFIGEED